MTGNQNDLQSLVRDINAVLEHKQCSRISPDDIWVNNRAVTNLMTSDPGKENLSQIIYDHYFKRANSGVYSHYTSLDAFRSIVLSQRIRLTSPIKRIKQGEYSLFYDKYKAFQFKDSISHPGLHRDSMVDLFYISLVKDGSQAYGSSRNMWSDFGDCHRGVRIIFDVNSRHPDFRHVHYTDASTPHKCDLLRMLHEVCERYNRQFVFASVSKIGAFFVSKSFEDENEVRFLVKKDSDSYGFPFRVKCRLAIPCAPYIEMPFDHDFATLKITAVEPGSNCDVDRLNRIVCESGLDIHIQTRANAQFEW